MSYQNCLHYAARANQANDSLPTGTWDLNGWKNYLANPGNESTARNWISLASAVKKLNLTTSGWRVPNGNDNPIISSANLKTSGLALLNHISEETLNFTKQSLTAGNIPLNNGTIVMGNFSSGGGVHYFVRKDDQWLGVDGPSGDTPKAVEVTGNSSFSQNTGGSSSKSGVILGWFS